MVCQLVLLNIPSLSWVSSAGVADVTTGFVGMSLPPLNRLSFMSGVCVCVCLCVCVCVLVGNIQGDGRKFLAHILLNTVLAGQTKILRYHQKVTWVWLQSVNRSVRLQHTTRRRLFCRRQHSGKVQVTQSESRSRSKVGSLTRTRHNFSQ